MNLWNFTGNSEAAIELRKELTSLRQRVEQLELELKAKDEEIKRLSGKGDGGHDERFKVFKTDFFFLFPLFKDHILLLIFWLLMKNQALFVIFFLFRIYYKKIQNFNPR